MKFTTQIYCKKMNEIKIEDINRIKDWQLSQLLHHLVGLEADR